ncbi:MAG: Gfo/Idh/MocA family oxidoreductase [Planctomycetes bacterium]|nr:Gfo/Idh/MocA family oxidoreductase [Planctomycetota bacterium]
MPSQPPLGIGLLGAGFLAKTRARCYRALAGRAELVAVASRGFENAELFAEEQGVAHACRSVEELLARDDVQLVDLCVPNDQHRPLCERAAAAGKHVVCTKPLTAYVGQDLPPDASDEAISGRDRREMAVLATVDARAMVEVCADEGVRLMYGENWIYAPSIRRAAGLLARANGTILDLRGGESHKGSHSPYSRRWRHTGGGALLRLGAHPLGAMLWLMREEGLRRRGAPILPVAVTADVADPSRIASLDDEAATYVARGWVDVESWGTVIVEFDNGARGVAWGADTTLGGMESRLEIQASNARFRCNLSPHDLLQAYTPHGDVLADTYLMEKLDGSAGWSTPLPDEDWSSGHLGMCADFVDCARSGRPPIASGELGLDVVRVVYAAYVAASEGRRVPLEELDTWSL